MDFLKELLSLKEQEAADLAVSAVKVDDHVHDQLDKAAKDEELDAQCFGLEMEDGAVVKVYVKKEQAEDFEEAMSKRLGEEDDIKTALEELGKEFEILEVVWPDEDEEEDKEGEEDEDKEDGSESLNDEVDYDDEEDDDEKKPKKENLSIGQAFVKRLQELKWSSEEDDQYSKAAAAMNRDDDDDDRDPADDIPDEHMDPEAAKQDTQQSTASSKWTIDKDDDGIKIANDRFSIELDDDEMMELMNAIADKKIARFKNEHGNVVYVFSPKGSEYILKTPEYKGGFRIPKDVVNKILD
jgi:hypothetical protein